MVLHDDTTQMHIWYQFCYPRVMDKKEMIIIAIQEDWLRNYLDNGLRESGYPTYPTSNGPEAVNLLSVLSYSAYPAQFLITDSVNWHIMEGGMKHCMEDMGVTVPVLIVHLPDYSRQLEVKKILTPKEQKSGFDEQQLESKIEELLTVVSMSTGLH